MKVELTLTDTIYYKISTTLKTARNHYSKKFKCQERGVEEESMRVERAISHSNIEMLFINKNVSIAESFDIQQVAKLYWRRFSE